MPDGRLQYDLTLIWAPYLSLLWMSSGRRVQLVGYALHNEQNTCPDCEFP